MGVDERAIDGFLTTGLGEQAERRVDVDDLDIVWRDVVIEHDHAVR